MEEIPANVQFTKMEDFDKHYIARIPTAVCVATTNVDGQDTGQTVAWIQNVSFNPPVITMSLGKQQYTNECIAKSKIFCVSFLTNDQSDIAKFFGSRSGRRVDKFANCQWPVFRGEKVPALMFTGANVCLECKVIDRRDVHYNTLIFGEVQAVHVAKEQKPTCMSKGITLV